MKNIENLVGKIVYVEYPPHGDKGDMLVTEVHNGIVYGVEMNNKYQGCDCHTHISCVLKIVEDYSLVNWLMLIN